jgi:AcrR family transcriptional regulator
MPRPSAHLDQKLVEAARALLPQTGFSALSVREVARRAGVNIGMFHYHFKTKNVFMHRVLGELYQDFLVSFQEAASGPGSGRDRLRRVLIAYARFGRRNRILYAMMMRELLNGQKDMVAFARKNFPQHSETMMRLMEQCRKEKVVRDLPTPALCLFAMSTMGIPNVAVTAFSLRHCSIKRIIVSECCGKFFREMRPCLFVRSIARASSWRKESDCADQNGHKR